MVRTTSSPRPRRKPQTAADERKAVVRGPELELYCWPCVTAWASGKGIRMPYCCSVRGRSMYCYKCRIHRSSPCDSIPPSMMPLARLLGHAWLNEAVDLGGIQTAWRLQAKAYREHPEYWDDDAWRPATEVATNEVEATRAEATDVEATDAETTEPENPAPEMAVPEINELEALSAAEIMVLREIIKERTG